MLISVLGDALVCGDKWEGSDKSDDLPPISNPCFSGVWSASQRGGGNVVECIRVLILVLMEYGLRVIYGQYTLLLLNES